MLFVTIYYYAIFSATGEPALLLAVVVTFALHEAIFEARKEYGYNDTEWVHVGKFRNIREINSLNKISEKLPTTIGTDIFFLIIMNVLMLRN